jgi:hypothetical protein
MSGLIDATGIVKERIANTMKTDVPGFTFVNAFKKSEHEDDRFLFVVLALNERTGDYAVWQTYNATTNSLNHGVYGIRGLGDAISVCKEACNYC